MGDVRVSIIIPTLANAERAPFLRRAVASALAQRGVHPVPIVVVNGPGASASVLQWLAARPDIRWTALTSANLPQALAAGRDLVDTPYFSELDDDDILLPHAMASRLAPMEDPTPVDVTVANGYLDTGHSQTVTRLDIASIHRDPLRHVLNGHWLYPGAALFRTRTITRAFFAGMPQYLEWTYLALRLALERTVRFIDDPSFVHFPDHPFGIWRSQAALLGLPNALEHALTLDLPPDVRRGYVQQLSDACQAISRMYRRRRQFAPAWSWQVRSIRHQFRWSVLSDVAALLLHAAAPWRAHHARGTDGGL